MKFLNKFLRLYPIKVDIKPFSYSSPHLLLSTYNALIYSDGGDILHLFHTFSFITLYLSSSLSFRYPIFTHFMHSSFLQRTKNLNQLSLLRKPHAVRNL